MIPGRLYAPRAGRRNSREYQKVKESRDENFKGFQGGRQCQGAVKRRIMDMGLTKGVEVQIRKVAPLGDPMEVTVRGYELSIRKADAEMVEVEGL